ncbi:hypothetical protein DQ04_02001100 [Trypanosoma grayi]|uniref:hypothetical protein n=1 Tax=Trypanosoma grayi TaxID=71804 RepID=UPI0004F3F1C8|nr:hypothetical protein DQ04_02001100 [Trypanosoma grayi]KEG12107.1 hypothetical protein DQ04_02001100 [Trypanosoma grayi]
MAATNEGGSKRVSFAYALVTASWAASAGPSSSHTDKSARPSDALPPSHRSFMHHTVDSLNLELELPFVSRYRVVHYLWQQCYRVAVGSEDDGDTLLPPRPPNLVASVSDDARSASDAKMKANRCGFISSTSLRAMDGISLHRLTTLAECALVLHPYSQRLDRVTRPILAFLQRTCTLQLSRRQNNIIGLLPKLMEILILLCHCLERGAQLQEEEANRRRHNSSTSGRSGSMHAPSSSSSSLVPLLLVHDSPNDEYRRVKPVGLVNRCGWWLSRLLKGANPRPQRLFAHVKELLLQPGPICAVKAMYLQFIAHRFFPQFPRVQRTPGATWRVVDAALLQQHLSQTGTAKKRLSKEPVDYDTEADARCFSFNNG